MTSLRHTVRFGHVRCCLYTSLLVLSLFANGLARETGRQLAFRNSDVQLKSGVIATEAKTGNDSVSTESAGGASLDDISEQKQTMESELSYAQNKLEAARKKLTISTAANNQEAIEINNRDVKDWESRVANCKAQIAQLEKELQGAINQSQGGAANELVLPGDNLEVYVAEDTSFNGKYPVRRGGYIIMPQIGRIYVAGSDLDGAERAIKKALESSQLVSAKVTVEKLEGTDVESGPVIYLTGEFRSPRPYRIPAGTAPTVVSVILSSGGVTPRADLRHVKVMRVASLKGVTEEVNVQRILDGTGGGLTSDLRLNDGDVLLIPAGERNIVYITGNVKKQGIQAIKPNDRLTCYAAILNSGGFSRFADLNKVHILREMPDGTKAKIPVNIKDVQRGNQVDMPLQPRDIIVVPEKFWSF